MKGFAHNAYRPIYNAYRLIYPLFVRGLDMEKGKVCILGFYTTVIIMLVFMAAFAWTIMSLTPAPLLFKIAFLIVPGIMILMILRTMQSVLGSPSLRLRSASRTSMSDTTSYGGVTDGMSPRPIPNFCPNCGTRLSEFVTSD